MLNFVVQKKSNVQQMKGSKLYSIFTSTCPVCQSSSMYKNKNPYKLSTTLEMHERCPHCGQKFKIEPSFFYGAMYVSYPVGIIFAGIAFVLSHWGFGLGIGISMVMIIITLIALLPIILRLSRNIWINFFLSFDKSKV